MELKHYIGAKIKEYRKDKKTSRLYCKRKVRKTLI